MGNSLVDCVPRCVRLSILFILGSVNGYCQLQSELDSGLFVVDELESLEESADDPPRKWAVLVGVNEYAHLEPLKFGRNDAERMYEVLTEHCGFEPRFITLITDGESETSRRPLKHNVANQLGRVFAEINPQDHVLVFFTGHGFISPNGEGYLATQETDPNDLSRTALSAVRVMQQMESLNAAQKIFILDCCLERSEDVSTDTLESAPQDVATLPLQFSQARGVVTFASCSPGQSSWELAGGNNGVFTHFLAKGLEGASDQVGNNNGKVELTEIVRYTTDQVASETLGYGSQQVPMALFGPETDQKSKVIATPTEPNLIKGAVGDKWVRNIEFSRTFHLKKGKYPVKLVFSSRAGI